MNTKMDCKTAKKLLSEAVDQRLSRSENRAFRAHILSCQQCRGSYNDLRTLQSWTHALPAQPVSSDFGRKLMQRIESGEGTPPAVLRSPLPFALRIKHFAYGASTAAALFLAAWLFFDGLEQTPSPDPGNPDLGQALDRSRIDPNFGTPAGSGLRPFVSVFPPFAPGAWPVAVDTPSPYLQDPLRIAGEVWGPATDGFEDLQKSAPNIAKLPPKKALGDLRDRCEKVHLSQLVILRLNGRTIFLKAETEQALRHAQKTLSKVLEVTSKSSGSREDVDKIVELIEEPRLPEECGFVLTQRRVEPINLFTILPRSEFAPGRIEIWLEVFGPFFSPRLPVPPPIDSGREAAPRGSKK